MEDFLLFVAVGFAAQIVDGAIGMAFGLISTTVLLSIGVPPAVASASTHAAEVFVTAVSGASHWRFKNIDWRLVGRLAVPGMIGGALGAWLLSSLPGDVATPYVTGYLLVMGCWIQVIDLLRANASGARRSEKHGAPTAHDEDVSTFLDALVLNWLICGTDAHAKNYSILIGGGGLVRLAPLYDVASILAYPDIDPQKAKLAMKIGDEYRLRDVGFSQWRKLATDLRVDQDALVDRARGMAAELPDRLADSVRNLRDSGLSHAVISVLADALPKRAAKVAGI